MEATKLIKKELKEMGFKSSVRSEGGCYGSTVRVSLLSECEDKRKMIILARDFESKYGVDNVIISFE